MVLENLGGSHLWVRVSESRPEAALGKKGSHLQMQPQLLTLQPVAAPQTPDLPAACTTAGVSQSLAIRLFLR